MSVLHTIQETYEGYVVGADGLIDDVFGTTLAARAAATYDAQDQGLDADQEAALYQEYAAKEQGADGVLTSAASATEKQVAEGATTAVKVVGDTTGELVGSLTGGAFSAFVKRAGWKGVAVAAGVLVLVVGGGVAAWRLA